MTGQVPTDAAPVLVLHGQEARYHGLRVISDINICIRPGERIALLGKSGVGKSTLLSLIYRALCSQSQQVALIAQDLGLVDKLSVWHNIYMGRLDRYNAFYNLLNLFYRRADRDAEITALATTLQLQDVLLKPAAETSGGQQQRAAIGRALYSEAPVILADEPVANLDRPTAELCMNMLTSHGGSAVIALHDVELALCYCDRIIGLRDGRVALDCAAAAADPAELSLLYGDASH